MARPLKNGLDYFSHDCTMSGDNKLQFIEAKHGMLGYAVFNKLLEKIYSNGYYTKWEERDAFMFAKNNNVDIHILNDIVSDCIKEGLFSDNLYNSYFILTSKSIQKRYAKGCCKRTHIFFIDIFILISVLDTETPDKVTLTTINGEISTEQPHKSTQRIGKNRKEKESKENTPSLPSEEKQEQIFTVEEFEKVIWNKDGFPNRTFSPANACTMANDFCNAQEFPDKAKECLKTAVANYRKECDGFYPYPSEGTKSKFYMKWNTFLDEDGAKVKKYLKPPS